MARLHGGIAIGFGGGNVGIALDAGDIGTAHVGDVFVLIADFLDGERNDFQAHLGHVVGAGGAHAIAHHFGLLDDFFDGELADDAAQMAFHDEANQAFALVRRFGEKLLGGGENAFGIRLHFDLRDGFHGDRDALAGVEILRRRDVERHQFERETAAEFDHGQHDGAAAFDDPRRAAKAVNDEGLVRPRLSVESGGHHHDEQDRQIRRCPR